jgi:hypothetical protein
MKLSTCLLGALWFLGVASLGAQGNGSATPDSSQNMAVRAYLDCHEWGCDRDYFVTEMPWVNWMRERQDAEIHLLVTSEATGSSGRRYHVTAIGQKQYAGRTDTLSWTANSNDSDDTRRKGLLRVISQVLLPYAAKTPLASRLSVNFAAPSGPSPASSAARDRWNFWTYSISANGFANGEKRQSSGNYFSNVEANRTTEAWKIRLSGNFNYDQSKYSFSDGTTYTSLQRSFGLNAMTVKSVNAHWSVGGRANAERSDYFNTNMDATLAGAVEWDYYPYKDFTRRKFTVLYSVGMRHYRYRETSIYDKDTETRPLHSVSVGIARRQPWGSANVSINGSQYLNTLKYYNAGVHGGVDVRVGKGFSVNLSGSVSRVRDQLYLPRGEASDEEVIARQQALSTNFRYFVFTGVRYQFGSMFNSVVNPRFGSMGGGGQTISMSF